MITPGEARAELAVGDLRCEYLANPQGIDVLDPRLSWISTSGERGERQTAYQILVASTPEKLKADQGDLWDTGRVASDASTQRHYAGKPVGSHGACVWKVRVWNKAGAPSAWSEPAKWSMGLLSPGDWHGKWIGLDRPEQVDFLTDADWIWFDEGDPSKSVPVATRYFRRTIEIPEGRKVKSAVLLIAADDFCKIFFNGRDIGSRSGFQSTKEINLTHRMEAGRNVIAVAAENRGNEPTPAALIARLRVEFESGEPMELATDGAWKSADKGPDGWSDPKFDDASWKPAKVIGAVGMEPWGKVRRAEDRRLAARYLRKEFKVEKPVSRAVVSYSGLGCSELYINGTKVGDAVLGPAVSQYPKREYYVTADVTEELKQGANAIGAIVGNGRFYSPRSVSYAAMQNFGYPKLLLHLRIEHADGTTEEVVSDGSWKLNVDGPIIANSEYDGEEYDARKELGAWSDAGYDDSKWDAATLAEVPTGTVSAQMIDPIRVTGTLKGRPAPTPSGWGPGVGTRRRPGTTSAVTAPHADTNGSMVGRRRTSTGRACFPRRPGLACGGCGHDPISRSSKPARVTCRPGAPGCCGCP